jgi:hypothetical protein
MKNLSRYDQEMCEGYVEINNATKALARKVPVEMVVTALLLEAMDYIEQFNELEQWKVAKIESLDVYQIIVNGEAYWLNRTRGAQ